MKLVLLGTTGYHPNDRRQTACFMLPDSGIVLDAGTAMYRVRDHLRTPTLDIFLTHAHLDHVIGLTFLFDVLWQREMDYVHVHAVPDKRAAIERHLFAEPIFPVQPPFSWRDLSGSEQLPCGAVIDYFPLSHPGGSIGYRLDWPDRSLAYVTDTTADLDAEYLDRIRDVDLLIHECHFPDGWEERAKLTGHTCLTPAAQVAAKVRAGQLVLVHINPLQADDDAFDLEKARKIFPNTIIGTDHTELEF